MKLLFFYVVGDRYFLLYVFCFLDLVFFYFDVENFNIVYEV